MTIITTIDDFKPIYKRRVPKMFYDYCESGSWTEQTFRENVGDFSKNLTFKQKSCSRYFKPLNQYKNAWQ